MLLHCVVDAILGALGLPDIGQIFPDSDPKWKGANSSVFMREAVSSFVSFRFVSFRFVTSLLYIICFVCIRHQFNGTRICPFING